MKSLNYGKEYRYANDEPKGYAAGENYFPKPLTGTLYYQPVDQSQVKVKAIARTG